MRTLVAALLQRNPQSRPSIDRVLAMPVVRKALGRLENDIAKEVNSQRKGGSISPPPAPQPCLPPPVVSGAPKVPVMVPPMVIEEETCDRRKAAREYTAGTS